MTIERVRQALRGISGVHVTPYGADGAIDVPLMATIVERIARAGVHNIVAAGNTGEFYTLTPGEIRLVHETAIGAAKGEALVTAAVGRSLAEAVATGREAAALGSGRRDGASAARSLRGAAVPGRLLPRHRRRRAGPARRLSALERHRPVGPCAHRRATRTSPASSSRRRT